VIAGREESDSTLPDHRIKADPLIRYVKVVNISGSAVHELRQLERQFRADGGRAIIIDLRGNEDRDVHQAVLLADALLDGGIIGRLRT
jgi:C-terminal processing protease CtpA/Prc